MKKYFKKGYDDGLCYSKNHWLDEMKEQNLLYVILTEAVIDRDSGAYFCDVYMSVGLRSEKFCGKGCINYNPRNGRSGCCKYSNSTYLAGKEITLINKSFEK